MKNGTITINDVAKALGVSKTTVSRAISGKGRIGEATRQRVLDYVEKNGYQPNVIAQGLAQSKTYNLCVVMPKDYNYVNLPYFQDVIAGVQEVAGVHEYDILMCFSEEKDVTSLARILRNQKVDGVVLLRTYLKDLQIELLQENGIPFVVVGGSDYAGVKQVDFDSASACRELTSLLLLRGKKRIALIGGNPSLVATRNRYSGFAQAYEEQGRKIDESLVFMEVSSRAHVDHAVNAALEKRADCILCMDDGICIRALRILRKINAEVPDDIWVASFYDSEILATNIPTITSLSFDTRELGREACKNLFSQILGESVPEKTLLPYEVVLKESTK